MKPVARRFGYVLWLMASFAIGQAQAAPLQDPEPVAVPPGLVGSSVATAIRLGSAKRGWMITSEEPGRMEATLHVRSHTVRVAIQYEAHAVRIGYLSSDNMDYRQNKGRQEIHGHYNSWVRNLASDISVELARSSAGSR